MQVCLEATVIQISFLEESLRCQSGEGESNETDEKVEIQRV